MIAGFMTWLGVESKPTEVTVQTSDEGISPEEAGVPLIPLDTFSLHPEQYLGQRVRLQNVQAQSSLGKEAYWLDMPSQVPFLLKADSSLVASGDFTMETGTSYYVMGRVLAMDDSVLSAWEASGAIQGEGERMQAEFATDFIEASIVRPVSGQCGTPGAGQDSSGAAQGQQQ
ncbi:MAG: hypothetical protein P8174_06795 [Gemmatimonadota bacterium]